MPHAIIQWHAPGPHGVNGQDSNIDSLVLGSMNATRCMNMARWLPGCVLLGTLAHTVLLQ